MDNDRDVAAGRGIPNGITTTNQGFNIHKTRKLGKSYLDAPLILITLLVSLNASAWRHALSACSASAPAERKVLFLVGLTCGVALWRIQGEDLYSPCPIGIFGRDPPLRDFLHEHVPGRMCLCPPARRMFTRVWVAPPGRPVGR